MKRILLLLVFVTLSAGFVFADTFTFFNLGQSSYTVFSGNGAPTSTTGSGAAFTTATNPFVIWEGVAAGTDQTGALEGQNNPFLYPLSNAVVTNGLNIALCEGAVNTTGGDFPCATGVSISDKVKWTSTTTGAVTSYAATYWSDPNPDATDDLTNCCKGFVEPPMTTLFYNGQQEYVGEVFFYAAQNTGLSADHNTNYYAIISDIQAVPEPASLALFSSGLLGLGGMLGRKLRK